MLDIGQNYSDICSTPPWKRTNMKLPRKVVTGTAALLLTVFAKLSMALPVITLDPNPVLGNVGDSIFVDLVWDGTVRPGATGESPHGTKRLLGEGRAPPLGG